MVRCPDCGAEFANTRGLGTHRHYAHGYQGEVRVKPGETRNPDVVAMSRRLARMEKKIEKIAQDNDELRSKLKAIRDVLK